MDTSYLDEALKEVQLIKKHVHLKHRGILHHVWKIIDRLFYVPLQGASPCEGKCCAYFVIKNQKEKESNADDAPMKGEEKPLNILLGELFLQRLKERRASGRPNMVLSKEELQGDGDRKTESAAPEEPPAAGPLAVTSQAEVRGRAEGRAWADALTESYARRLFAGLARRSRTGRFGLLELEAACARLACPLPAPLLRRRFWLADQDKDGHLTLPEFLSLVFNFEPPSADGKPCLLAEQCARLAKYQAIITLLDPEFRLMVGLA